MANSIKRLSRLEIEKLKSKGDRDQLQGIGENNGENDQANAQLNPEYSKYAKASLSVQRMR